MSFIVGDGVQQDRSAAKAEAWPSGQGPKTKVIREWRVQPARTPAQGGHSIFNPSWEDVANRMIIIELPAAGQPFKCKQIEEALNATGVDADQIGTVVEFEKNFKYRIKFANQGVVDLRFPNLPVTTVKGNFGCTISSILKKEYKVKVSWFPDDGSNQEIAKALLSYCSVLSVYKETIHGAFAKYFLGNHIVTSVPYDINYIPDFLNMTWHESVYTTHLTVLGLPPRCLTAARGVMWLATALHVRDVATQITQMQTTRDINVHVCWPCDGGPYRCSWIFPREAEDNDMEQDSSVDAAIPKTCLLVLEAKIVEDEGPRGQRPKHKSRCRWHHTNLYISGFNTGIITMVPLFWRSFRG